MATNRRSILGLVTLVVGAGAASQWWAAQRQSSLGERLAQQARPGDIRMLASTTCAICKSTRQWLTLHGVAFDECFIETSTDCAALFEATRSPGTPVMLVRGVPQVGFDPQRVSDALKQGS